MVFRAGRQREEIQWIRKVLVLWWKYIHWGIQEYQYEGRKDVRVATGWHSHTLQGQA